MKEPNPSAPTKPLTMAAIIVAMNSPKTLRRSFIKWRAAKSLDKPRNNEWSTGIGDDKKRGAGKITIAEQIACESGNDHPDNDRPPHRRAERDQ